MKKHYRKENNCLNCETTLAGKYCHNCGQENLQIQESFGHMMNHAISDYFHFDHQFFHTLKPLLFKPGYLTNEYMAGRRVQYLHPVKMYIFISIVYFLLLFQNGQQMVTMTKNTKHGIATTVIDSANKKIDKANNAIANNHNLSSYQKKKLEAVVKKVDVVSINKDGDADYGKKDFMDNDSPMPLTSGDSTYQQYITAQNKLSDDERDGIFEKMYNKKAFSYNEKYGSRAKEVFWDEFKHNVPKMMFVMLPLFALILRVSFWKNRKFYVEHLIYTFHLHCFLFLFLAIIMLLEIILPINWHLNGWINFVAVLFISWYIYKSLKAVYHRSRWRTISKIAGIAFMYFFVFAFCVSIVLFITAITAA